LVSDTDREEELQLLDQVYDALFPLLRSITGDGLRQSLAILQPHLDLELGSVASGTPVLDWVVPPEWVVRDAWLRDPDGDVVVALAAGNLHVVNYSEGVDVHLERSELDAHLYSLPALPEATPYVTSYYERRWGFCLPEQVRQALPDGTYHAHIDAEHVDGRLDYGHTSLPGDSEREVLLSTYLCHPSMANNELSGPLVALLLHRRISRWPRRRFTYRFVVAPETIGAIAYLAGFGEVLVERLHAGLVLTCLGGTGHPLSYKQSRSGIAPTDVLVDHLAASGELEVEVRPFDPSEGSDERQWCSPGFDLPVGQAARLVYGRYPEYHSSADDKALMDVATLVRSADELEHLLLAVELDGYYVNTRPVGEVMLSRHGLHPSVNAPDSQPAAMDELRRIRFVLSYSDGRHSLREIADRCGCTLADLATPVERLRALQLLDGPFDTPT
jgi:aminopeptidase-like protein